MLLYRNVSRCISGQFKYHGLCSHSRAITTSSRELSSEPPAWRPAAILDEWVAREARPLSLRQLTFYGRSLTESRLLSSANYVREELPTRIAHRLRNLQTLPFAALKNPHLRHVYELYYSAFDKLRQIPKILTLEDNEAFCKLVKEQLLGHLTVIPRLCMGVTQAQDYLPGDECDKLMTTLLRSRISRRVICEQHIALTETFHSLQPQEQMPNAASQEQELTSSDEDSVGQVLLKCHAREIIEKCTATIQQLITQTYGPDVAVPEVLLEGHLESAFPYIPNQLEYIVGELLRNSMQAVIKRHRLSKSSSGKVEPIQVLICESPDNVIIRVSDQGGGIDTEILPHIWSFAATGPRREENMRNLELVPKLVGSMEELTSPEGAPSKASQESPSTYGSLSGFTSRPSDLRLGLGLPISRVYAEYWAGKLELHNLEGYGVDAFLQISKFGNRNEVLSTRASMDAL